MLSPETHKMADVFIQFLILGPIFILRFCCNCFEHWNCYVIFPLNVFEKVYFSFACIGTYFGTVLKQIVAVINTMLFSVLCCFQFYAVSSSMLFLQFYSVLPCDLKN